MQQLSELPTSLDTPLRQSIAALLDTLHKPDYPGGVVLAARDGEVVFRGAYGLANVELQVPNTPSMVFRLASMTKQFTTTAIMLLVEQGKLRLEDDLATLLPEYPSLGHHITVEHLMTHTSGIKSYTDMPEWYPLMRNDITLDDLIALFKDLPLEFVPGERFAYNNSGYLLLGAIIERVSGQSYEAFLREHVFAPLGMQHTQLDHTEAIVPGRVAGYERGPDGIRNAGYLSMTHPHAAGALLSTVDDLLLWDEALYTDRIVSQAMLTRAHTPFVLNDGMSSGYGYGWGVYDYDGVHAVAHAGGINGFNTYGLRLPDEHVYVAVLLNNTFGEPHADRLAMQVARLVLGKTNEEPQTVVVDDLGQYTGVYAGHPAKQHLVRHDGDHLVLVHHSGVRNDLLPMAPDRFFVAGSFVRVQFNRDEQGQISGFDIFDLSPTEHATRTDLPLPAERSAITLPADVLERYKGSYEFAPTVQARIDGTDKQLTIQMPGQEAIPIYPESETVFFVKVVEATVIFAKDERGAIIALEFDQGGQKQTAKRV